MLLHEPRGHSGAFGLVPVASSAADFGAFFISSYGYPGLCGHAIMGYTAALRALGRLSRHPRFTIEVPDGILAAMGHAFFTLSVGVGSIMVFGSYMPKESSIGGTVITVALLDTVVALTAGMALFPIVFAAGLEPGGGPGLMFVTLPIAFGNIAMGQVFGLVFFVLVAVAAWSSAISMLEPAVAYWVERTGYSRARITAMIALFCWIAGLGTVLSFNLLADAKFFVTDESGWRLFAWGAAEGKTIFETIDYLTSRIMLPLGGLCFLLFAGWVIGRDVFQAELRLKNPTLFPLIYWLMRYVAPVGVVVVFVTELFK
jgi:NSS family neurotransmitter:Na+ symporter